MGNAFIDKLCGHVALTAEDIALVVAECANARDVDARDAARRVALEHFPCG